MKKKSNLVRLSLMSHGTNIMVSFFFPWSPFITSSLPLAHLLKQEPYYNTDTSSYIFLFIRIEMFWKEKKDKENLVLFAHFVFAQTMKNHPKIQRSGTAHRPSVMFCRMLVCVCMCVCVAYTSTLSLIPTHLHNTNTGGKAFASSLT